MATEIFKKDLESLQKLVDNAKILQKQIKGINKPMKDFEKTSQKVVNFAEKTTKAFDKLYGIIKRIGLTGLLSGGGLALRGAMAQKSSVEAKTLGITSQQKGALEYAGKQTMANEGFFKSILSSIKEATQSQSAYDVFGLIGLDKNVVKSKNSLEQLNMVLNAISSSSKQLESVDKLKEVLGELTGLSVSEFKALDLDKFQKTYKEGLGYFDNSNEKLKVIGESFNRVTANIQLLADKVMSALAPAFSRVLDNITKGLNAVAQNPAFQKMMDSLSKWLESLSKGFDEKITSAINSIPEILRDMQVVFLRLLSALAEASTWLLTGESDTRARKFAESATKKADLLELERYKESLKTTASPEEFIDSLMEARNIEKKYNLQSSNLDKDVQKNFLRLEPQINLVINNDPTQAQMQKNFTTSIMLGGSNGGDR